MSTLRRILVAATAVAVAFGASAPSSWGQDPAPPDQSSNTGGDAGTSSSADGVVQSWALAPAGSTDPGEAGNRPNLSYEVEPGAELTDAITLYNFSNSPLTFRIYPTDAINNSDGQFDLIPGDEEPTGVGTWIELPQDNITVAAGSQATMPITVKVPSDASPGDHAGAILASNESLGTQPDGKVVMLDRRTGSRVYIRVTGALNPDLVIENVDTKYTPTLNPLGGSAEVTYRLQNRGNVRLSGAHSVSISGPFGVAKKRIPAEDLAEILPGEGVTLQASFDDLPATVLAFTTVRLDPNGTTEDGLELTTVTRGAITLAPPLTVILGALAVWLALRARRAYLGHRDHDLAPEMRST